MYARQTKSAVIPSCGKFVLRLISSHSRVSETFSLYPLTAVIPEYKWYKKFYTWSASISKYEAFFGKISASGRRQFLVADKSSSVPTYKKFLRIFLGMIFLFYVWVCKVC